MNNPGNTGAKVEAPVDAATKPATVLIVDDSADIREITQQILEQFTKFKVITASNGHEALQSLLDNKIDVIVLDDHMPEMSGAEFFAVIRQRSVHVPVIFLTGLVTAESRKEQLSLGAYDYLEKPIRAKDLILLVTEAAKVMERIHNLLERKA